MEVVLLVSAVLVPGCASPLFSLLLSEAGGFFHAFSVAKNLIRTDIFKSPKAVLKFMSQRLKIQDGSSFFGGLCHSIEMFFEAVNLYVEKEQFYPVL